MSAAARAFDGMLAAEFRRRLLEARKRLLRTVAASEEEIAALEAPEPGDPIDRASAIWDARLAARLGGQDKHELDEILDALRRLADGTFGTCESCGQPIGFARLRAMPAARFCVRCQATQEQGASASGG